MLEVHLRADTKSYSGFSGQSSDTKTLRPAHECPLVGKSNQASVEPPVGSVGVHAGSCWGSSIGI